MNQKPADLKTPSELTQHTEINICRITLMQLTHTSNYKKERFTCIQLQSCHNKTTALRQNIKAATTKQTAETSLNQKLQLQTTQTCAA
jgi:hypothetical protein